MHRPLLIVLIAIVMLLAISTLALMNNACKSSQHEWCASGIAHNAPHAFSPSQAKFLGDHPFYVEGSGRTSERRLRIVRHSFQWTFPIAEAFQAIRIRE
jgi:hypothetical protein